MHILFFLKLRSGMTLCLLVMAVAVASLRGALAEPGPTEAWRQADEGLFIGEFASPPAIPGEPSLITVVKVDPAHYHFRLLCASENDRQRLTVKEWSEKFGLTVAFNAGMYQQDGFSSVGFMKNHQHVNNGHLNKNRAVLAFNPVDTGVPPVQIIDRDFQDFESLKPRYRSFVQSIRMISLKQKNVWNPQPEGWNTLAIAVDRDGNVLLIFDESRQPVHQLVETLLSLPLAIVNAMYLEGGPQASLYVNTPGLTLEKYGHLDSLINGSQPLRLAWPIPNVIGLVKK